MVGGRALIAWLDQEIHGTGRLYGSSWADLYQEIKDGFAIDFSGNKTGAFIWLW